MIPNPHDLIFKAVFGQPEHARRVLCAIVPAALAEALDWSTLALQPGSFVDAALHHQHTDLLYAATWRDGGEALVYLLFEHQSTADPAMPLRTLSYRTRVWNRFRKECPDAWLPPIITVLVSHAPGGWTTSRSLDDMFDPGMLAIPGLSASIPRSSLIIDDLIHLSNADLKARKVAAFQKLALWLLRDARAPRHLLDNFETWIVTFAEAERAPAGTDAIATLLTYMFRVIDPVHHDELRAKIHQLGPHAEETTMTIAEMWLEEGREQGRIAALRSQLRAKFGAQALDATYEAHLQSVTPAAVDRYLERVLVADSLNAVFED